MSYASLHNHDMFSYLDGYGKPKEMLERAREVGLTSLAITNHGNVASLIYYDLLKDDYPDIKVIYGCELYEAPNNNPYEQDKDNKYFHLIALARNEKGRIGLNHIISKSNFEGFYFKPRTCIDWIKPYAEDLVITSACMASKLSRESDFDKCVEYINEYKSAFPYFYLEMQSHNVDDQEEYNKKILELSKVTNTPFIITTDTHYANKEDAFYQDKLIKIGRNSSQNDKTSWETMNEIYTDCYIQSEEEIHAIMDKQIGYDNVCIGLRNTNEIDSLCEQGHMPFQSPQLPTYPLPEGFNNNNEYLLHLIENGWYKRGYNKRTVEEQERKRKQLNYEMSVIHSMGFDGYFIIVWDFINWAKTHGVEVGDGRGSGVSSEVCYALGITDVEPSKYGLIFERFLNPERTSMPDLDVDLSDRDVVIKYLTEKYGENRVCQIINFNFITPTVAITDVGKVLGFNYNVMQKLSQKFTSSKWSECMELNPNLLTDNPQYEELFDIASHLSGRVRGESIHAGGVGIVDTDVNDYCAMKIGKKGEHIITVDKHYVENIGIIKLDLLGVATLSMVREIKEDLKLDPWETDINNPEFENDLESYQLLASGKTDGVFQVESGGMKDLMVRLKPKSIHDVSAVVSLYRPDSMGALEEYVEIATTDKKPIYIHDDMRLILEETNGCLLYQEQLLEIVKKFGGRTYGQADLFRRGIGKKDKELVQKESEKLRSEIVEQGYTREIADKLADDMSAKGGLTY